MAKERRVVWTHAAREMVEEAAAYVAEDSPAAACALVLDAIEAGDSLQLMAERGRIVSELAHPELRELIVQRYRLIYRVKDDEVELLAFVHGARDFRRLFGKTD